MNFCDFCLLVVINIAHASPLRSPQISVQVNAFPPSPKAAVDLYVSSNHGESDTTITLRFPTYKTLNYATPDVRVELVMV